MWEVLRREASSEGGRRSEGFGGKGVGAFVEGDEVGAGVECAEGEGAEGSGGVVPFICGAVADAGSEVKLLKESVELERECAIFVGKGRSRYI